MEELQKYLGIVEKNYLDLKPRFNEFACEIIQEQRTEENVKQIWFYVDTVIQKLTPMKEKNIKELLGCVDLILLDDGIGYYQRRKLAIRFT